MRTCSRLVVATLGAALSLSACNDPYSQRRIGMRQAQLSETLGDIGRRENDGARRVEEANQTLKKWWQSDSERFNRKIPTIGDYFW